MLDTTAGAEERLLLDILQRAMRAPGTRIALVLHLSRLRPPAPRPHHRRVARALLHDTAEHHDGQVFALRNGDLVLLCENSQAGLRIARRLTRPAGYLAPDALPAMLLHLMRIDTPDPAQLLSVWQLATAGPAALAYAQARLTDAVAPLGEDVGFGSTATLARLVDRPETELLRQTAVLLAGAGQLRPLFHELVFAPPAQRLEDPFLHRHLAERLSRTMLAALDSATAQPGRWAIPRDGRPMLHIDMTLAAIEAIGVADIAARVAGVEIALQDAVGNLDRYHRVRLQLQNAGVRVVLDHVPHRALFMLRSASLQADLLKLDWSAHLAALDLPERPIAANNPAGPGAGQIVLHRAATEAALRWGLKQGIRRFQGLHVDAMQAAERMLVCPHAAGCGLGQCRERATATLPAGRLQCHNLPLLDGVGPSPLRPGQAA